MKPFYADLGDLKEDDRIEQIAQVAKTGKVVGFVTDDEPGKADRYIAKLKARVPNLTVLQQGDGPVAFTILVTVQVAQ